MLNVKFFWAAIKIIFLSMITFATFAEVVYGQAQVRENVAELINQKAARNINDFILDKLQANRIVMLADAEHGYPIYMQTVIAALNHWVTRIEQQPKTNHSLKLPTKLYLILEMDSLQANTMKQYFATGNLLDVIQPMSFIGDQFTTGTLEFYEDLRILVNRINHLDAQRGKKDQIQFEIVGPEKIIDLDQWSFEKRDHFFIYERDEYSSAKIIDLLAKAPEAKAFIFYGGGHLCTVQTRKQAGNQQGMGYFLGYYLTEYFHDKGGVYSFDQALLPNAGWLDEAYKKPGISYAIDNSIFDGVAIPTKMQPQPSDGSILHFAKVMETKHIGSVWTENFVEYIFQNIDKYKDTQNDFHKMILGSWFYYLSIVAGKELERFDYNNAAIVEEGVQRWKRWHESAAKLDVVCDIENLTFWKRLIDRIGASQDPQATQYEMLLSKMVGYKVWFHAGAPPPQRAESYWRYLNQYRKPIVIENLIPLLWVGTDSEKQKARAVLEKESGQKFATVKEWLRWWNGL